MSDKLKSKKAPYGKKFFSAFAVSIFTIFTVCFFSPMEIYMGNIIEFKFSASTAALILAVFSFALATILSVAISFLPPKILRIVNLFIFSGGLCVYIQSMLLNGSMGSLTGDTDIYSPALIIGNILIWIAVFAVVFAAWLLLKKFKKAKYMFSGMRFAALALVLMQLVGFFSLYLNLDSDVNKLKNSYFTDDGRFELSKGENTVYFIIDTCDGDLVEQALEQYPDMFDGFGGFTYFPNMTTTHSRTFPSITYLLSGQMCYFDKPYPQYVNEAFENSTFIDDIDALGTDIRLYTEPQYIGESVLDKIDNHVFYDSSSLSSMNISGFIKQSLKVSAYRGAPYAAKKRFEYTSASVNKASMKKIPGQSVLFNDVQFCADIKTQDFSLSKNYTKSFRLHHLVGSHPGANINANGNFQQGVSLAEAARGCLHLIEEYMNRLKQQGVFDNTTIIITADHGYSASSADLSLPCATSCIMMVKPAKADSSVPMKTSLAPVCHEDLFATVIDSLGGNYEKYGRTIFEIGEDEDRERKYYHTALYDDIDGEVALREYSVTGDARDLENYHLTGKYWDVLYSERAVSKHRLSDVVN